MKNSSLPCRFLAWAALAASLSFPALLHAQVTDVGKIARNFRITDRTTGQPINMTNFAGSIIVLDFFAWWCGPCVQSSPDVEQNIQQYYRARGGNDFGVPVLVIGVNIEESSPENTDAFVTNAGMELVGDDFAQDAWTQFNTEDAIPLFVIINGTANSTTHQQWEVLLRTAGYPGAVQMRRVIDSVRATATVPIIYSPPANQDVVDGQPATFSVAAEGMEPLTYQWSKDGMPLAGATQATLTIPAATSAQAGLYTVVVTAANQLSATASAQLRVYPKAPVVFQDRILEDAIRAQLGYGSADPIYKPAMMRLSNLDLYSKGFTNLTGIEAAENLSELRLAWNQIFDISPLQSLTNLTVLDLDGNKLADLTPLRALTNLRTLELYYNRVVDTLPLAGLTNLHKLDLGGNYAISNLVGLAALVHLEDLSLGNIAATDLSPLSNLASLRMLRLLSSQSSDYGFVFGLTNLTSLELSRSKFTQFSRLAELPNLQSLYLSNLRPGNFAWLAQLPQLSTLFLEDTGLSDLSALSHCKALRVLSIGANQINSYQFLTNFPSLVSLYVRDCRLRTLAEFPALPLITSLDVSQNQLETFNAIAQFPKVRYLYAGYNHLTDISGLRGLSTLSYVNVASNWLDLSPGSESSTVIETLRSAGVTVYDANQSFPISVRLIQRSGNTSRLRVEGKPGRSYLLQRSTDLRYWTSTLSTNAGSAVFELVHSSTNSRAFYRVISTP